MIVLENIILDLMTELAARIMSKVMIIMKMSIIQKTLKEVRKSNKLGKDSDRREGYNIDYCDVIVLVETLMKHKLRLCCQWLYE